MNNNAYLLYRTPVAVFFIFIFCLLAAVSKHAHAELSLVGNTVVTLVDNSPATHRQSELVTFLLQDSEHSIAATTQAWIGSGLSSGEYHGYIDHYSLNQQKSNYYYSDIYLQIPLHIAARQDVSAITDFNQIKGSRIGAENRFANTHYLRQVREVNWSRAPLFFENIKQIAGRRVDYILADKYLLNEFNLLLTSVKQEPLNLSIAPLILVDVMIAINKDIPNAYAIINSINKRIISNHFLEKRKQLMADEHRVNSYLDPKVYKEVLQRW